MVEINDLYTLIFKVDEGSGICLKFEAEKKCYILTAYHCIKDCILQEEEINLLDNANNPFSKKGKIYFDKKNDIALIEIEYIPNLLTVEFESKILPDDDITFMGYPKKALGRKRKRLNGEIIEWNNKKAVNITESIEGDFTEEEKTREVFSGFSGSGVFKKRGQKLTLVGLLKSLPEENFDYKEISCVAIEDIKELIDEVRKDQQKENEITETIKLKNGKTFKIELVKVELEDKTLYVGKYPVTFEEYDLFCEDIKKDKPNDYNWGRKKRPVIDVSWNNAIEYCNWLSKKDNKNYRLLSSTEWTIIAKRDVPDKKFKKYIVHSKLKTEKVGSKKVGQLGLYDFIGNVYEWCENEESIEKKLQGVAYNDSLNSVNKIFSNEIMVLSDTCDYIISFRIAYSD